jgi:hypothetical protein
MSIMQALLRVSSLTECLRLLDAQMGKDPSLMLVLEEAVRMGMEGRAGVLTHYLPAHTSTGIQRPGNQDLRTWGMSRKSLEANGPGGFVQVGAVASERTADNMALQPHPARTLAGHVASLCFPVAAHLSTCLFCSPGGDQRPCMYQPRDSHCPPGCLLACRSRS